jgi:hypothetical protein
MCPDVGPARRRRSLPPGRARGRRDRRALDQVDVGDAPATASSSPSVAAAIAELGVPGATAQELR